MPTVLRLYFVTSKLITKIADLNDQFKIKTLVISVSRNSDQKPSTVQ